ncbi:MAG: fimbria major subunit [Bacteroides sp.]|nr:fimbria major subunit [Bacteroides sp.]
MANFKKFFWTLAALPLLAACSTEDTPLSGSDLENTIGRDGVYMAVTLDPSGRGLTRSTTDGDNSSSGGVEIGSDAENAVKTVLIVLADRQNKFIGAAAIPDADSKGTITAGSVGGTPLYQTVAKFDKTVIADYYNGGGNGKINVYVYCNPAADLITKINATNTGDTSWLDFEADLSAPGNADMLWDKTRGFLMTNVRVAERDLPTNLADWAQYNTASKAFDLSGTNAPGTDGAVDNYTGRGSVSVQRLAARFDFRDGSQVAGGNGIEGKPFTYAVVNNVNGEAIVNCEILAMALTNMSKTQYYLGRVSNDGLPTGAGFEICGPEKAWFNDQGGNYVVSTNAAAKASVIKSDFDQYFNYPFFSPEGIVAEKGEGWDWKYCSEIVQGDSDNYADKSYHVWRYIAENTIPYPMTKQVNAQSTGVVFKTRMLPTDKLNDEGSDKWENMLYEALAYDNSSVGAGKLLYNDPDKDPILYSLSGNSLYVTWENVREAALYEAGYNPTKGQNQSLDRTGTLYRTVYGTGGVGTVTDEEGSTVFTDDMAEDLTSANYLWQLWEDARKNPSLGNTAAKKSEFKKKATSLGFTLYQTSQDPVTKKWGYYCYYYYWNRHNDNGEDGVMGPMEFAVVRNNVYKLSVTSLKTLGHPRIPENDPDDPKPETPDEKSEVYLTVSVDVVPWVVRINDIEF